MQLPAPGGIVRSGRLAPQEYLVRYGVAIPHANTFATPTALRTTAATPGRTRPTGGAGPISGTPDEQACRALRLRYRWPG